MVQEISTELEAVLKTVEMASFRSRMNQEGDALGAFVEIRAGAGGVESMDFVRMLLRMYQRWAEQQPGYTAELADEQPGEVSVVFGCFFVFLFFSTSENCLLDGGIPIGHASDQRFLCLWAIATRERRSSARPDEPIRPAQ